MTNAQTHETDAFQRVKKFSTDHAADFSATSTGGKQFAIVTAAVPQAQSQAAGQLSGKGDRGQATITKGQIHPDLHDQMKAISESAHTLADLGTTGLDAKFRMPRSGGHGALLTAARQFLQDATPLKTQFLSVNLSADFLDTLTQTISDFDSATDDQTGGLEGQAGSTASLANTNAAARKALRALTTIVRNTYKNNPAVLAEWTIASHIQSGKAHHATPPAPAPAPDTAKK
jgi:hypothetical protein